MSASAEVSGVTLRYVTREIIGDIEVDKTEFDENTRENVLKKGKVKDPVIVFFPNKTSQVMARKRAEEKGFLNRPDILNFSQVTDQHTAAGKFKHALHEDERQAAWLDLENAVISKCVGRSGHPVNLECQISDESVYFSQKFKENENGATEF